MSTELENLRIKAKDLVAVADTKHQNFMLCGTKAAFDEFESAVDAADAALDVYCEAYEKENAGKPSKTFSITV